MRKILRVTCLIAIALFFINFMTYQTSRMPAPISFNFYEVLMGKVFTVSGVEYTSGFNLDAALALGFAVLAALCAWIFKRPMATRIGVFVPTVLSIVFLTRSIGVFGENSPFVAELNQLVKGGVSFQATTPYALVITMLALNAVVCLTTYQCSQNLLKYKWFFLMIVPAILFVVVFVYIPMAGLVIVFLDYNIADIFESTWVGLKWFRLLGENLDGDFGRVVVNTLVIGIGKILVGFPAPILLALMFNECRHMGFKRTVQTISYLPYFISWSIVGGLIIQLFSSQYSVLNGMLRISGNEQSYYLLNEVGAIRWTLILSTVWKNVGWNSIIYMAALTAVNPELYESAKLDGAGRIAQTWHITLPGISHIVVMQLIFAMPGLLGDNFDQALNLVYPMTVNQGKTLSMYIYEVGIRGRGNMGLGGNYSFSTAIGLSNSIISLALLFFANLLGKRINEEGAIW